MLPWVQADSGTERDQSVAATRSNEEARIAQPKEESRRVWRDFRLRALPTTLLPIAGGADINGDGYSDLVVGGPLENDARGQVIIYLGGPAGFSRDPSWDFAGDRPNQHLGIGAAFLDVNGDGLSDIVVSEASTLLGVPMVKVEAAVHVFFGTAHGTPCDDTKPIAGQPSRPVPTPVNPRRRRRCEWGRVRGSCRGGHRSFLPVDAGRCLLVFHGSRDGLRREPALIFRSEQDDCNFAATFTTAGDVNGDGFDDLVVSAPRFSGRRSHGGKVYLFLGSRAGLQNTPAWTSEYPLPLVRGVDDGGDLFFGWGLGAAGDVNHDGLGDVLVGA